MVDGDRKGYLPALSWSDSTGAQVGDGLVKPLPGIGGNGQLQTYDLRKCFTVRHTAKFGYQLADPVKNGIRHIQLGAERVDQPGFPHYTCHSPGSVGICLYKAPGSEQRSSKVADHNQHRVG